MKSESTNKNISEIQGLYMMFNHNRAWLKRSQSMELSRFILQKISNELHLDNAKIREDIESGVCTLELKNKSESEEISISFEGEVADEGVYNEYIARGTFNKHFAEVAIYFSKFSGNSTVQEKCEYPYISGMGKLYTLQQVFQEEIPKLKMFLEL